jgi:hypothetical protein
MADKRNQDDFAFVVMVVLMIIVMVRWLVLD